jgi:hypothetical protein
VCVCRFDPRPCLGGHARIGFLDFLDGFANRHLTHPLEIWQSGQEQGALNQAVRFLHFVDGFFLFVLAGFRDTPMLQCPDMQKILIDRSQFAGQLCVEM